MLLETTLAERVEGAIHTSPHFLGRRIRSETDGSRVILQGIVASYYQKQMAQEIVRRVDGVEAIDNHIEVAWLPLATVRP
jgi:osmotically-inducible protein OsmY